MPKDFKAKLSNELSKHDKATSTFERVLAKLNDIAQALAEALKDGKIKTAVEPGFSAAVIGQQFNVVVYIIDRPGRSDFRDVLFRAYIPTTGFPVQLDFYGEELERIADADALELRILRFFQNPSVKSRLQALQAYATRG